MNDTEIIKSKVDIVEIISSYIPLKKAGRNFAGLCPFHSEKTPSFMVSSERQVFKCFGCGEGGDVFTFLEKMEGWDFREALTELAQKAGVKLTSFKPSGQSQEKEKILSVNNLVSKFYAHLLNKHPRGEKARKYLTGRGIKIKTWEKFGLGYAPAGWENTLKFLTKRGFSFADIASAGLIISRDNTNRSFYDRFRDRLIFPIRDSRGTILGFSARIIEFGDKSQPSEIKNEAKYINTPQTTVFNKGSLLFGLDIAREAIRKKNEVVLVEGEFDVLSANQAGIENIVASKGTALADGQVVLISRLCEKVFLCFDTDLAGDAASRRGIELLDMAGVSVEVVKLGKYKDPDEFCQKDAEGFKKAIAGAVNIYDYFIESASSRFDPKSVQGKKKIGQEILPVLSKISDDLVRAHYIAKVASILDLDVSLVASAVEKKSLQPIKESGDFEVKAQGQNVLDVKKGTAQEKYFLALFISQDEIGKDLLSIVLPSDFEDEKAGSFWKWIHAIIKTSKTRDTKKLLKRLPKELGDFVDSLYFINIGPAFSDREFWAEEVIKIGKIIKKESLKRQLLVISKKMGMAEKEKNSRELTALTKRFGELSKNLKKE